MRLAVGDGQPVGQAVSPVKPRFPRRGSIDIEWSANENRQTRQTRGRRRRMCAPRRRACLDSSKHGFLYRAAQASLVWLLVPGRFLHSDACGLAE